MKILIIGGNRFTGKLLAEALIKINHEVTVFNRKGTGPEGLFSIIKGDRNNLEDLKRINFTHFDYIVDMCLYNPRQFKLIEPLLEQPNLKKYIFISSIASKITSFGNYGIEKQLVEDRIKNSTLPYIILQPTYIIGEKDHSNRLLQYINNLLSGKKLLVGGKGNKLINFVDVNDVCGVILKLIDSDLVHKEYEIGNSEMTSLDDLIYRLSLIINKIPKIQYYATTSPYTNNQCFATNFKIKQDINYSFTNFDNTLKEIYSSYENKS
tara:strand:- start:246 stop:1043 length:798 start_codon:yes stop_codon:yes gene_type:complete